jgi:ribose transport system substrate-binding protein
MSKQRWLGAAALLALITSKTIVSASEHYTFALVPRNTDSPYFDDALAGCKKAADETAEAAKLNSAKAVKCLYIGPGRNGGSDEQALIIHDLISNGIDGIAVAPSDVSAVANALKAAGAANIPIVTWYSDLPPTDTGLRAGFVGSDNYQIGVDLAKLALQKKLKGGVVCIQSGSATSSNDNERIQGIRDTLAAKPSKDAPVERLNGQNGWKEADGCPLYAADDAVRADQQMDEILARYPDLSALVLASALAQLRPAVYSGAISKYKERIASGQLIIVSAETLPTQLQLLKDGLSSGQVGQRPFEMGYRAMYLLKDLKEGKTAPNAPIHPGLSVCTLNNVDNCVGDQK